MSEIKKNEYREIFETVKNEILKSQYRVMQAVNKELVFMYWHIGKIILENAEEYPDFEFVQQVVAQIPWGHNVVLLDKIKNFEERKWYIEQSIKNDWSRNILNMQISSKLYERQAIAEKTTNFQKTLPDVQSDLVLQTIKDPYIFDFISLKGKVKEAEVENAMIQKIKDVLIELGNGFAFV